MPTFPLLERYIGHRLDADLGALAPGRAAIAETARRLGREESYLSGDWAATCGPLPALARGAPASLPVARVAATGIAEAHYLASTTSRP
mgnify:CR=1 FL=1